MCSVSQATQVLKVGPEGMSPSSHLNVATAPSVVPDTVSSIELWGNTGKLQSAVMENNT